MNNEYRRKQVTVLECLLRFGRRRTPAIPPPPEYPPMAAVFARIQTGLLIGEGLLAAWVLIWMLYRLEKILPWNG